MTKPSRLRTVIYDDTILEDSSTPEPYPGLSGPKVMPEFTPGIEPVMPTAPGMEDPSLRQIELADGGVVEREEYGRGGANLTKAQRELASQQKSVWLKTYSYDDLEKDIKAGKSKAQIADTIYNSDPKLYDQIAEQRKLRNGREGIYTALEDRLRKRPELFQTEKKLAAKEISNQEKAIKDISNYINKKKKTYKELLASNKIGSFDFFKKDVLDYAEKKYPNYVKSSTGDVKFISGQKIFTPFQLIKAKRTGEYGVDVALNKKIREALGIPERPKAGEGMKGDRSIRAYNQSTKELLDEAIKQGFIPKIDPQTGKPITTESQYYNYIKRSQINPVYNVFGKKYKFGMEHVGGISKAKAINDPETLAKIVAIDPYTNRFVKSTDDTRITNKIKVASISEPKKAKKYVNEANELIKKAENKYGLELTKYKLQNNKIVPVHPKMSLDDPLFDKVKRAINTFIATGRHKEPTFKELPTELKQAITSYRKGNTSSGNRLLQSLLKKGGYASIVGLGGMALNDIVGGEALAEIPNTIIPEEGFNKTQAGVLAGAGAVATKTGRKILGKMLESIGTPLTLPLAGAGIGKALDPETSYGEHLKEMVTDPFTVSATGFTMPAMVASSKNMANLVSKFSPAAASVLEKGLNLGINPNTLSKFGTGVLGPVAGLYHAGEQLYDLYSQNKEYLDSLTQEERDQISLNYLDETVMDVFKQPSTGEYIEKNIPDPMTTYVKGIAPPEQLPSADDLMNMYAYGGRVGLKDAGDPKDKPILPINPMMDEGPQDPGKRDFLKGAGGIGLAGLLLGTGLLKLGKSAAVSSKISTMVKNTTAPSWMEALITKVMKEGVDSPRPGTYIDRNKYSSVPDDTIITKELKFKNPETGQMEEVRLRIDKDKDSIMVDYNGNSTVAGQGVTFELKPKTEIVYSKDGKYLTSKPVKGEYEFQAIESEPRVVNWDGDIEFDGEVGVKKIIDLNSDISGLKSYVTGGKGIDKKIAQEKRIKTADVEENPLSYLDDTYDSPYPDWDLPD